MKLLVDENLSSTLVQLLAAKGVAHVAHLGPDCDVTICNTCASTRLR